MSGLLRRRRRHRGFSFWFGSRKKNRKKAHVFSLVSPWLCDWRRYFGKKNPRFLLPLHAMSEKSATRKSQSSSCPAIEERAVAPQRHAHARRAMAGRDVKHQQRARVVLEQQARAASCRCPGRWTYSGGGVLMSISPLVTAQANKTLALVQQRRCCTSRRKPSWKMYRGRCHIAPPTGLRESTKTAVIAQQRPQSFLIFPLMQLFGDT